MAAVRQRASGREETLHELEALIVRESRSSPPGATWMCVSPDGVRDRSTEQSVSPKGVRDRSTEESAGCSCQRLPIFASK